MDYKRKRLDKIKLALTTRCNLACPYCFVEKTGVDMSLVTAKKAADLLLASPGRSKLLSLYGGEPLLKFDLIRDLTLYAKAAARKKSKELIVSICTNLTLLSGGQLDFMREADIRVLFGCLGEPKAHDRERKFPDGSGTSDLVSANAARLRKSLKPENIGVSFCVFPGTVGAMYRNFLGLVKSGLNYVNFEIIREYKPWTETEIRAFSSEYGKILAYAITRIAKGEYIYINPVNWEIKYSYLSLESGPSCPFRYHVEVYPGGDMSFSPFLLNHENKERYVIGNLDRNEARLMEKCRFGVASNRCRNCLADYAGGYVPDSGADRVAAIYRSRSFGAAEYITERAGDKVFKEYIRKIKEEVCF